jgi:chromosome segregation ATPase
MPIARLAVSIWNDAYEIAGSSDFHEVVCPIENRDLVFSCWKLLSWTSLGSAQPHVRNFKLIKETMSTVAQENWQSVEGCLASLRSESDGFESELDVLFADLDQLRHELGDRAQTVEQQRQEVATQFVEFSQHQQDHSLVTQQLELQEARLAEAIAELEAKKAQLVDQEEQAITAADEKARSLLQQFQHECDTLKNELESSTQALTELREKLASQEGVATSSREECARVTQQLIELQQGHAETLAELGNVREQLSSRSAEDSNNTIELEARLRQIEATRDSLNNELESSKQALTELREKLTSQEGQATSSREECARVTQQLIDLQQSHSETLAELGNVREQLSLRSADDSTITIELETRLRQVEGERDSLRSQLDQSLSEIGRLSESTRELTEARDQIVQLRAEVEGLKAEHVEEDGDQHQQVADLEQERATLETELELVRGRASELQEQVMSHERSMEEQQQEMSAELRQLRELVERNASSARKSTASPVRPTELPSPNDEATPNQQAQPVTADPVVNSVMAQFAKLQKDVSARRKKRKE